MLGMFGCYKCEPKYNRGSFMFINYAKRLHIPDAAFQDIADVICKIHVKEDIDSSHIVYFGRTFVIQGFR